MLKKIFFILIVVIISLAVFISSRPEDFRVTRSVVVTAPQEAAFNQVNDLHKWEAWSPWAKLDPNAKNSYEGPQTGTGAALSWAGNNEVGEGKMTIIESVPSELVRFRLDFLKPFTATNTAEFTFKSDGDKTTVVWSMFGKNNFLSKAVGLFMDCDKMVGDQFEHGLSSLKQILQTPPAQ